MIRKKLTAMIAVLLVCVMLFPTAAFAYAPDEESTPAETQTAQSADAVAPADTAETVGTTEQACTDESGEDNTLPFDTDVVTTLLAGMDSEILEVLKEHPKLAVRCEAGKNPGGVVVIKQLSSKFQIKLITKLADPFSDVFRLHGKVLIIVKSDLHVFRSPNILFFIIRSRQRINCFLV